MVAEADTGNLGEDMGSPVGTLQAGRGRGSPGGMSVAVGNQVGRDSTGSLDRLDRSMGEAARRPGFGTGVDEGEVLRLARARAP